MSRHPLENLFRLLHEMNRFRRGQWTAWVATHYACSCTPINRPVLVTRSSFHESRAESMLTNFLIIKTWITSNCRRWTVYGRCLNQPVSEKPARVPVPFFIQQPHLKFILILYCFISNLWINKVWYSVSLAADGTPFQTRQDSHTLKRAAWRAFLNSGFEALKCIYRRRL